jgi:hypothetical protein
MILMAKYLVSVLDEDAGLATPEEMAAIDEFNEQLREGGHWVFAGGLGEPSNAIVIDGRYGKPIVTDGPYVESKEHLAGFWIIEAPDAEVARRLATLGSMRCNRKVELRPFLEA